VMDAAVSELRGLAEMRGIRIHLNVPTKAVGVRGNRPALRRLFLVLLDNAVKYSNEGATIEAAIESSNGFPVASVKDHGPGIRTADLPHIFKRFYRADEARTRFYQADEARTDGGFGLGLSLADTIARGHGASIEVQSAEGEGSTFRVVFGVTSGLRGTPAEQIPDRLSYEPPSRRDAAVPNPAGQPGT